MIYLTGMKNNGSSVYREERPNVCNEDFTTAPAIPSLRATSSRSASTEDFSRTSYLLPAGTSLLHTNGYSNAAESSTVFGQLHKVVLDILEIKKIIK